MNELEKLYEDLLDILEERLIPITITGTSIVFYYKMKGDIGRYLVEFGSSENNSAINLAQDAYKTATDVAQVELDATHPLRLGADLNFFVFYYEIWIRPSVLAILSRKLSMMLLPKSSPCPKNACTTLQ
ncbi:tyrosine 3-monooxygenase/tryptophan 5-monooxygenase activation protein [Fusarium oxysporum NRRL 32931]|uniref:Tyrosine 3-monooxygenase/tryptophan 5-monooxygenase activation protein n=1 Tax=Fusarium oxysporum NRRL 32931 TaxID=660029 RepID=W9HIR9_FUSOX|nr:tyrosine 3-monooxygenase/tryptophan 5-monooxygenase activation protein [Fusarium oxysporum NRRL 32931]